MHSIRRTRRINKYSGSFYESDQEDNLKDLDYNPNEFYEKLITKKSQSNFQQEILDGSRQQNFSDNNIPVEAITGHQSVKKTINQSIDFKQYITALSLISGTTEIELQSIIDNLSLKDKKQLLDYCENASVNTLENYLNYIYSRRKYQKK